MASTKKGMEGVIFNGGRYEGAMHRLAVELLGSWRQACRRFRQTRLRRCGEQAALSQGHRLLQGSRRLRARRRSGSRPSPTTTTSTPRLPPGSTALVHRRQLATGAAEVNVVRARTEFSNGAFSPLPGPSAGQAYYRHRRLDHGVAQQVSEKGRNVRQLLFRTFIWATLMGSSKRSRLCASLFDTVSGVFNPGEPGVRRGSQIGAGSSRRADIS